MVILSTYHQSAKYNLREGKIENSISLYISPFDVKQSYYVDDRFYLKKICNENTSHKSKNTRKAKVKTKPNILLTPRNQKKDAKISIKGKMHLEPHFMLLLEETNCSYVDTFHSFTIPRNNEVSHEKKFD